MNAQSETPKYLVEVNLRPYRDTTRRLKFATLKAAVRFANEVFQATGQILAITEIENKGAQLK